MTRVKLSLIKFTDTYYRAFSHDRVFLKSLVSLIMLLQTLQALLLTDTAFKDLALGFGQFPVINQIGTVWLSICVIGGASGSNDYEAISIITYLFQWDSPYKLSTPGVYWSFLVKWPRQRSH